LSQGTSNCFQPLNQMSVEFHLELLVGKERNRAADVIIIDMAQDE